MTPEQLDGGDSAIGKAPKWRLRCDACGESWIVCQPAVKIRKHPGVCRSCQAKARPKVAR